MPKSIDIHPRSNITSKGSQFNEIGISSFCHGGVTAVSLLQDSKSLDHYIQCRTECIRLDVITALTLGKSPDSSTVKS